MDKATRDVRLTRLARGAEVHWSSVICHLILELTYNEFYVHSQKVSLKNIFWLTSLELT